MRGEIRAGLIIIEDWDFAKPFIQYGKGREFASNCLDNQEISMLGITSLANIHGVYYHH
jgi:TnpA family transposase